MPGESPMYVLLRGPHNGTALLVQRRTRMAITPTEKLTV